MAMYCYRVAVGKREYRIEISENKVLLNGEPIQASLIPLNKVGLYLFQRGDRKRELHVRPEGKNRFTVMANGHHVIAEVETGNGLTHKRTQQRPEGEMVAPMPGMVVNVPIKEDQQVEKGEILVVLESMKMQMELRAPFSGKVTKILTKVKAQVDKGTLLLQVLPV